MSTSLEGVEPGAFVWALEVVAEYLDSEMIYPDARDYLNGCARLIKYARGEKNLDCTVLRVDYEEVTE